MRAIEFKWTANQHLLRLPDTIPDGILCLYFAFRANKGVCPLFFIWNQFKKYVNKTYYRGPLLIQIWKIGTYKFQWLRLVNIMKKVIFRGSLKWSGFRKTTSTWPAFSSFYRLKYFWVSPWSFNPMAFSSTVGKTKFNDHLAKCH